MLKVDNIRKEYKNQFSSTQILKDVSLTVNEGEWISIVGPSGSGKSTLLNISTGLLKPNSGEVLYNNINI